MLALAVAASSSPAPRQVQSIAIVRIEKPASADKQAWEHAPKSSRREITIRDARGQPVLLRVIQYE